mmetsp:Transcript_2325/g.6957  ORF Transcript_2325/g.6957 Transcript_2325/m.6957 type:complete len:232 (+) Transcript_2325:1147-1842(+)
MRRPLEPVPLLPDNLVHKPRRQLLQMSSGTANVAVDLLDAPAVKYVRERVDLDGLRPEAQTLFHPARLCLWLLLLAAHFWDVRDARQHAKLLPGPLLSLACPSDEELNAVSGVRRAHVHAGVRIDIVVRGSFGLSVHKEVVPPLSRARPYHRRKHPIGLALHLGAGHEAVPFAHEDDGTASVRPDELELDGAGHAEERASQRACGLIDARTQVGRKRADLHHSSFPRRRLL